MEEAGPSQTQSDEQSQGHTSKLQRSYESLDESTKQTKVASHVFTFKTAGFRSVVVWVASLCVCTAG